MTEKAKKLGNEPITTDSMNAGLSKREYFAAMAMQGLLTNLNFEDHENTPQMAVEYADALLEELSKTE